METKQHHDVYNATSRSVKLRALPQSLSRNVEITREDLPVEGARAFVLHNFLTYTECQFFIDATEEVGYECHSDLAAEYPPEYRNNQRLIVISHQLADDVWKRLQPQLQFKDIHNITPIGFATEGIWLPSSINEGFLFSRYKPGQYFKPHYDGMYKNANEEVSIFTVTIYLNDNFTGGAVKFFRSREDPTLVYTYIPKRGDALIFNHDVFHEGETLKFNNKYIARSCIMFQRMSDLSDPAKPWEKDPTWIKLRDEFDMFDDILDEKNPMKFAETYLRLQSVQLNHARSIKPDLPSILPYEIVIERRSLQVCKSWHSLGINGGIWREMYAQRWGRSAVICIEGVNTVQSPGVVNWKSYYSARYGREKESKETFVLFPGEYLHAKKAAASLEPALAQVYPHYNAWDNSFNTYLVGEDRYGESHGSPVRYTFGRGVVATAHTPLRRLFSYARDKIVTKYSGEYLVVITNRLAWGPLKEFDHVIGFGTRVTRELLDKDKVEVGDELGISVVDFKKKYRLPEPNRAITCSTEFNAAFVPVDMMWAGAHNCTLIDRPLCLAYGKGCGAALVICEEHEFSEMPAQLNLVPVIGYKVAHQHEKLVEIFYNTARDEEYLTQFVQIIRDFVHEIGGAQVIDSKILFHFEEELAQESFLFMKYDALAVKLKASGFSVDLVSTPQVMHGAESFAHSQFASDAVLVSSIDKYSFGY